MSLRVFRHLSLVAECIEKRSDTLKITTEKTKQHENHQPL
jgi:hypothetical protein